MIRDWKQHSLYMDFSNLTNERGYHPSDIDLFWIGKNHIVFGEIKNECGSFTEGQMRLFTKLVDGYKGDPVLLLITHNKYIERGDTVVDVAACYVKQYYYKHQWHVPRQPTTVKQFIDWA